jgi:hypothetical protein
MATGSQAGAGGPHRHFTDHLAHLRRWWRSRFGRADWVWGHRCRRARYPSRRSMSAAAGAAARRATAPAHRCNVGRAARRGTIEHWVATGAPEVASRLRARTFPRGPPTRTLQRRSRSPNGKSPRMAKSISEGNADRCLRGEPVAPESRQNQDELRLQTPRGGARSMNGIGPKISPVVRL